MTKDGCNCHPASAVRISPRKGHPRFHELLEAAAELHAAKSQDYGAGPDDPLGNLRAAERLGVSPFMGVMIRMQDKMARLEALVKNGSPAVVSESMTDTLRDLAAYSYLAIILWEESKRSET